jgi:antitoxin VapB
MMGSEYLGKTFKSGNSIALRLPKGLGFKEGEQVRMVELTPGNVRLEIIPAEKRKLNVDAFWGKGSGLKLLKPEDRVFAERKLDWTGARLNEDE